MNVVLYQQLNSWLVYGSLIDTYREFWVQNTQPVQPVRRGGRRKKEKEGGEERGEEAREGEEGRRESAKEGKEGEAVH